MKNKNDLPDPEECGSEYEKVGTVYAVQMREPFDVETLEGPVKGKRGDFLCKGESGEMWPIDQEIFLKTYVPKMTEVFRRKK